ncbi:transposase family protein, partial [Xenorhabdus bovienii]|uniref:transposase family protein n=1 Tax=Xenorhabdus bovienii TaxID=40576 RepID=UPI0023B3357F
EFRVSICAVICGCKRFNAIDEYEKPKENWFRQFLDLTSSIPSHDTFNDVVIGLIHKNSQRHLPNG